MHKTVPSSQAQPTGAFNSKTSPYVAEGSGTPLQYSCVGNPMDGGAW